MDRLPLIALLMPVALFVFPDYGQANDDPVFDSRLSEALNETLESTRARLNTNSLSASLYISDRCYWEAAIGVTTQDPQAPVDSDTIYGFGSITKTFVAGIVLQLAEEKKLDLDDPLGNWLPRIKHIDPGITVRQLLNHGSGLSGYYRSKSYWAEIEAYPDRKWRPEDTLQYERRPRETGSGRLSYSNTNYLLLGMIIEAISGNSLAQELQNRVTLPLNLKSTYLPENGSDLHRWADSTRLSTARISSTWAAGAIGSTAKDIAKWTQTLHSGEFVQPATLAAMRTTEPRRLSGVEIPMGLGVWKLGGEALTAWGHGGRYIPFLSATYFIPELDISVAHSFIADAGEQFLPGKLLIDTYLENQPADISMCFDSR